MVIGTKSKTATSEKRVGFRFSMDSKKHADLIEFLETVPKALRGGYIIEAVKLLKSKMTLSEPEKKHKEKSNVDLGNLLKKGGKI